MRSHILIISSLVALVLSFSLFALPLSKTPFSSHGEAREAVVVTDMLEQHNLILPLRNGVDIPSKPPLFHWLAVAAANALDAPPDELSIRLPSAFTGAVALSLIFVVVSTFYNPTSALLVLLVTMTSFEWARSSSLARVDMVFTACLTISFFLIHKIVATCTTGNRPTLRSVIILGLSLGLATLSKGPAGAALAGLAGGIYFAFAWLTTTNRQIVRLPIVELMAVVLIAVSASGWWYYLAYLQGGEKFIAVQLLKENAARAFGLEGYAIGHENPFYFSVIYLLLGFLPWSLLIPLSAAGLWKNRALVASSRHSLLVFSLIWLGVFLVVVTMSGSKRIVYFLPAYPALAMLTVLSFPGVLAEFPATSFTRQAMKITIGLLILLCTALLIATSLFTYVYQATVPQSLHLSARDLHNVEQVLTLFQDHPISLFGSIALSLALLLISMRFVNLADISQALLSLACAFLVLIVMAANYVYPTLATENSPKTFMAEVRKIVPDTKPFYQFKENIYSAMFYAERNLLLISTIQEMTTANESYLLATEDQLPEIKALLPNATVILESSPRAAEGRGKLILLRNR